jgi:hypothetical protein
VIEITPGIAIGADKRSFTICYPRKKRGATIWEAEFFYSEPEQLFRKLALLAMAEGIAAGSWEDVARRLDAMKTTIAQNLAQIHGLFDRQAAAGAGEQAQTQKPYRSMGGRETA